MKWFTGNIHYKIVMATLQISIVGLVVLSVALLVGWKPKMHPLQYRDWHVGDCFMFSEHESWEKPSIISKIMISGKERWGVVMYDDSTKEWSDAVMGWGKDGFSGWFAPLKVDCPYIESDIESDITNTRREL